MLSPSTTSLTDLAPQVSRQSARLSWTGPLQVLGATSITLGILWDISWHETIGRDTFWTPAHMAIYLGGILGGAISAWLIYQATFNPSSASAAASVRLFKLRGPIGAWVALWGAAAMVISAPFDNWWHNTYGLDVKILSPPHSVLAAGMHHVVVGIVLLVLSAQNRATNPKDKTGRILFLYASGLMLVVASVILTEHSFPNEQHANTFYFGCALLYPAILISVARAAKLAWPATTVAAIYMLFYLLLIWILPLFPARPQLAPIYNPVQHMVPPPFPLLLVAPAIGLDLILQWSRSWTRRWYFILLRAPLLGVVFLGLLIAVQWPFAKFLISPAADNWFFSGQGHWPYWAHMSEWNTRFWRLETNPVTLSALVWSGLAATISAGVGLFWGSWMSKVQR